MARLRSSFSPVAALAAVVLLAVPTFADGKISWLAGAIPRGGMVHVQKTPDRWPGDVNDKMAAIKKAFSNSDRIPTGVFYEENAPTLAESLAIPSDGRLRDHKTDIKEVQAIIDELVL